MRKQQAKVNQKLRKIPRRVPALGAGTQAIGQSAVCRQST